MIDSDVIIFIHPFLAKDSSQKTKDKISNNQLT